MVDPRFLLVARDTPSGERFRAIAEQQSHRLVTVSDAREALRLLERESCCLAIVDLVTPSVSGWHLIASLKSKRLLEGVPLIGLAPSWDRPGWLPTGGFFDWVDENEISVNALNNCLCQRAQLVGIASAAPLGSAQP